MPFIPLDVAGLPPLLEGVACVLGPQQWIKDSTLWIFIYLMVKFIPEGSCTKELSVRRHGTK